MGEIIKNTCWREGNIIVWLRVEWDQGEVEVGQFGDDKLGGEGDGQHLPPGLHKTAKQGQESTRGIVV